MFVPNRTMPMKTLIGELADLGCEIALHSDEVLPDRLSSQRETMERVIGDKIYGVSYHGKDLSDQFIHKLTGKTRYVSYHNPYVSLQAGFEYDATGFTSGRPQFLEYSGKRILLFPGFSDITAGPIPVQYDTYDKPAKHDTKTWAIESVFDKPLSIFLIHPFYLNRYGFKKGRIDLVGRIFDYVRRNGLAVRTYKQVLHQTRGMTSRTSLL